MEKQVWQSTVQRAPGSGRKWCVRTLKQLHLHLLKCSLIYPTKSMNELAWSMTFVSSTAVVWIPSSETYSYCVVCFGLIFVKEDRKRIRSVADMLHKQYEKKSGQPVKTVAGLKSSAFSCKCTHDSDLENEVRKGLKIATTLFGVYDHCSRVLWDEGLILIFIVATKC